MTKIINYNSILFYFAEREKQKWLRNVWVTIVCLVPSSNYNTKNQSNLTKTIQKSIKLINEKICKGFFSLSEFSDTNVSSTIAYTTKVTQLVKQFHSENCSVNEFRTHG